MQTVGAGSAAIVQIRSEALDPQQVDQLQEAMFSAFQPTDSTGTPRRTRSACPTSARPGVNRSPARR